MKYMKQIELDPYVATIKVKVKGSNIFIRTDIDADANVNRFQISMTPIKTAIAKVTAKVRDALDSKDFGAKLKKIGFELTPNE